MFTVSNQKEESISIQRVKAEAYDFQGPFKCDLWVNQSGL